MQTIFTKQKHRVPERAQDKVDDVNSIRIKNNPQKLDVVNLRACRSHKPRERDESLEVLYTRKCKSKMINQAIISL